MKLVKILNLKGLAHVLSNPSKMPMPVFIKAWPPSLSLFALKNPSIWLAKSATSNLKTESPSNWPQKFHHYQNYPPN